MTTPASARSTCMHAERHCITGHLGQRGEHQARDLLARSQEVGLRTAPAGDRGPGGHVHDVQVGHLCQSCHVAAGRIAVGVGQVRGRVQHAVAMDHGNIESRDTEDHRPNPKFGGDEGWGGRDDAESMEPIVWRL